MGIFDWIRGLFSRQENEEAKVIDLSDMTQYPASVLADLNYMFALGDDSENFLRFLHEKWRWPISHRGWDDITHEDAVIF